MKKKLLVAGVLAAIVGAVCACVKNRKKYSKVKTTY